jgi:tetratricopeptide (TPR) repeat protein
VEEPTYLNFDLRIEPWNGGYRARVVASPVDRGAVHEFSLSPEELDPQQWSDGEGIRTFGERLFKTVFDDDVYSYLRQSQDETARLGADGLRIRLLLTDVPELANLPWEYLYDPTHDQFLSLSTKTPIVRYLDLTQRVQPLSVRPPLKVLVMISSPSDQPALDVEHEWTKLNEALAELQEAGRVVVERIESASLAALQTQLRRGEYHVFHYIGHGLFDERTQDGFLLFENEDGRSKPVSGQMLGTLLHDEPTLRLVLLNACEGAKGSRRDPFAGTAQSLVRKRIPAVIAMQAVIVDEAAKTFAYEFYRALADDYPVDAALTEARKIIYGQGYEREWGIPVLFMRTSDGYLDEREQPGRAQAVVEGQGIATPKPKRVVRVGKLTIPLVPLVAASLAVLVILALVGVGASMLGPSEMEGRYNVAVADVGVLGADGKMQRTEESQLLTKWVVEEIEDANRKSDRGNVEIWHDGLPLSEKRVSLGMISGETAGERAAAANELAEQINAHVVIYGHLTSDEAPRELVLEFYVAPRVRIESAATIGRYRVGDPISMPENFDLTDPLSTESLATRVENRAALLFWLMLSLKEDLLGRPSEALAILRQAEAELSTLRPQGDGKELLYYFKGRAALFLDFYDEAEEALLSAVQSNPTFARAQIALGSVYLDMAQTLESPEERFSESQNLERATNAYQKGVELARAANEPLTEVVGRLALAQAYRLEAETYYVLQAYEEASRLFEQAVQELKLVLGPLADAQQYRLLAQAYATLGAAYTQHGQLWQRQEDLVQAKSLYTDAREAYVNCIAQGDKAPEDEYLRSEVIAHQDYGCQRMEGLVGDILLSLGGE